jgi:CBS domain-containing protein
MLASRAGPGDQHRRRRAVPIRSLRSMIAGRPPIVAASITTVVEAARTMKQHNIGALLVVDLTRLIGIFTERDALDEDLYELRVDLEQRETMSE